MSLECLHLKRKQSPIFNKTCFENDLLPKNPIYIYIYIYIYIVFLGSKSFSKHIYIYILYV